MYKQALADHEASDEGVAWKEPFGAGMQIQYVGRWLSAGGSAAALDRHVYGGTRGVRVGISPLTDSASMSLLPGNCQDSSSRQAASWRE